MARDLLTKSDSLRLRSHGAVKFGATSVLEQFLLFTWNRPHFGTDRSAVHTGPLALRSVRGCVPTSKWNCFLPSPKWDTLPASNEASSRGPV